MSAIPSWARVGAKVVCVDAGERVNARGSICLPDVTPIVGCIYTIRKVVWDNGDWCVFVREVRNIIGRGSWRTLFRQEEAPYLIGRFAPVVDDEIEAVIFRGRKVPTSHEVDA